MTIGEQIRAIRYTELKHTQVELARSVGISTHHLRMIESGESKPSIEVLERIANRLGYELKLVK